jgi:hypothetical protein
MVLPTHVLIFYKIPRLDMYSNTQQLHGIHAQHIKNEWQCQQHLGENGRPGACYITPNGIHIGLNIRRLASWAAAMVCHFLPSLTLCSLSTIPRLLGKLRNTNRPTSQTLTAHMMVVELCQGLEVVQVPLHSLPQGHHHPLQSRRSR